MMLSRRLLLSSFLCCIVARIGTSQTTRHWMAWSLAQSMLWPCTTWMKVATKKWDEAEPWSVCQSITQAAWAFWEDQSPLQKVGDEPIPTVDVQEHLHDLKLHLEVTFGSDWKKRPLLLKGLWSAEALRDSKRRLSTEGLLLEELEVPYFADARRNGALSPDSRAPICRIVANITQAGAPHKIGTQLLVQTYPDLIKEVAPLDIMTELFGSHFSAQAVKGSGPFGLPIFPASTTVPVFVASGTIADSNDSNESAMKDTSNESYSSQSLPFTELHCEPIGNIAVQLSGRKKWTLVQPEFSHLLKPSISPDGRAFFASWANDYAHVPSYNAVTAAGDAIWVPTWTWHRVDYLPSDDMAIGASLFHFRPVDFVRNNPLFGLLILPAIFLELVGFNTQ